MKAVCSTNPWKGIEPFRPENILAREGSCHLTLEAIYMFIGFFHWFHMLALRPVPVHCNQGMSRSPGIVLLCLTGEGVIKNGSFHEARAEFEKIYPGIHLAGSCDAYHVRL